MDEDGNEDMPGPGGLDVFPGEPGAWVVRTETGDLMTIRMDGVNIIITEHVAEAGDVFDGADIVI